MAKAVATCTCSVCGKTFHPTAVKYNRKDADEWEAWAADHYTMCSECELAQREADRKAANAEAAEVAEANGWCELKGTDKQVAWAQTLRATLMSTFDDIVKKAESDYEKFCRTRPDASEELKQKNKSVIDALPVVRRYILSQGTASWFIDNRRDAKGFISELVMKVLKHEIAVSEPEEPIADTVLMPQEQKHEGAAEVRVEIDTVSASYTKDEDFRAIVKNLGYKWNSDKSRWEKAITATTGTAKERAAELVNRLLNAGFAVSAADAEVREAAVHGSFEPETSRWISYSKDEDRFIVRWNRGEKDFYSSVIRIPTAKWKSDLKAVAVSTAQAAVLVDFAEINGFRFTADAKSVLDRIATAVTTVDPSPVQLPNYDEHPVSEILNSSREIIPDLKDE